MNIHYHGYLLPSSKKFQALLKDVFCFIAPSCSEGISPSVATCLQSGLYPIISHDTGIVLPGKCGLYIEELSTTEIEKLVLTVIAMKDFEIIHQVQMTQTDALHRFSRSVFQQQMEKFIINTLTKLKKI
jgi:glycosyltransferase involved in cell wall biosynthesis